jgi:hypothetical protein
MADLFEHAGAPAPGIQLNPESALPRITAQARSVVASAGTGKTHVSPSASAISSIPSRNSRAKKPGPDIYRQGRFGKRSAAWSRRRATAEG